MALGGFYPSLNHESINFVGISIFCLKKKIKHLIFLVAGEPWEKLPENNLKSQSSEEKWREPQIHYFVKIDVQAILFF